MGWKNPKNAKMLPIFLGGPMGPIHPVWGPVPHFTFPILAVLALKTSAFRVLAIQADMQWFPNHWDIHLGLSHLFREGIS